MAETPLKRQWEETHIENIGEEDYHKRQKSYSDILSLLDEEEEEPNQDLSSLITTLQQELSSESGSDPNSFGTGETDPENPTTASSAAVEDYTCTSSSSSSSSNSPLVSKEDEPEEEEEKERVMRHLLEASDDELGIPNMEAGSGREIWFNGGDTAFSVSEGLWELEDEAANYYALLQSELFM
ncbi:zinc finger CCHC domain protein [Trema orientale]|uniref:Zinc finger CCHC domain protein n=1 Tax=Trema orientale TaxID=63057 RepID=A0A2P5D1A9_TREOI|nr:zinc finger CCHC domain protein [Trema orientale]